MVQHKLKYCIVRHLLHLTFMAISSSPDLIGDETRRSGEKVSVTLGVRNRTMPNS